LCMFEENASRLFLRLKNVMTLLLLKNNEYCKLIKSIKHIE